MNQCRCDPNWNELVYYDETSPSGLRWKVDRLRGSEGRRYVFRRAGEQAGAFRVPGGRRGTGFFICLGTAPDRNFAVHRIIYQMEVGDIPEGFHIDHIDGDTKNNQLSNLRAVPTAVNSRNQRKRSTNTSGVTGVHRIDREDGYVAWQAFWRDIESVLHSKSFSVAKLGETEAFRLACEYRANKIKELNMQGAGYTEDHGVRE